MFIIITGNPMDGIDLWGPYEDPNEAAADAERIFRNCDWWITHIHQPDEVI